MCYAYRIPHLAAPEAGHAALAADPVAKRLVIAGPWQLSKHPEGGVLASWSGTPYGPENFGAPVPTSDGMFYYPALPGKLTQAALAKPDYMGETIVTLANGMEISVALATKGGRKRTFAGRAQVGDFVEEFSQIALRICGRVDAEESVPLEDPELARLLYLAVARRYRVTEEALDQWGILTTADDGPLFRAIIGADPKAGAAAGAT